MDKEDSPVLMSAWQRSCDPLRSQFASVSPSSSNPAGINNPNWFHTRFFYNLVEMMTHLKDNLTPDNNNLS